MLIEFNDIPWIGLTVAITFSLYTLIRKKINISTKYPGLTFNEIEGISLIEDEINIAKKQKRGRLCLGVGGGYGVTFTKQSLVYHGPQIGVFLIYSPKWLQF